MLAAFADENLGEPIVSSVGDNENCHGPRACWEFVRKSRHNAGERRNRVGVMGKGLALDFKLRYPAMFRDFHARCAAGQRQTIAPTEHREGLPSTGSRHATACCSKRRSHLESGGRQDD